ncbi:sigma-E factor negative regulatory protein [Halomonas cerina]|uniref:Sigma-E factor negative regulatory protein RseA n=1 Tax=Halomonas cerina TaxID=447424 RepID=A0A839VEF7_9GAMM|nr:sigma-E factor negative regulatory protein [Halomonas cerina]MBB3191077.1 sigma-E factor negative regulatory protein RseA [Halomonas cerina]
MSQNARESLSALMDNEGDELELRRALKALENKPDAADAWRRYHLMRSLMHRDTEVDVTTDLSAGILARLQDEPTPAASPASDVARRSLPFARSAGIAAAVSLMVITGVQFYQSGQPEADGAQLAAPVSTGSTGGDIAGASQVDASPASVRAPSLTDLPMFQGSAGGRGLMTVGAESSPLFSAPMPRQSLRSDQQQALLLQSYLDRHAEGAAYAGGDVWMPLLRASGNETLGQP